MEKTIVVGIAFFIWTAVIFWISKCRKTAGVILTENSLPQVRWRAADMRGHNDRLCVRMGASIAIALPCAVVAYVIGFYVGVILVVAIAATVISTLRQLMFVRTLDREAV